MFQIFHTFWSRRLSDLGFEIIDGEMEKITLCFGGGLTRNFSRLLAKSLRLASFQIPVLGDAPL